MRTHLPECKGEGARVISRESSVASAGCTTRPLSILLLQGLRLAPAPDLTPSPLSAADACREFSAGSDRRGGVGFGAATGRGPVSGTWGLSVSLDLPCKSVGGLRLRLRLPMRIRSIFSFSRNCKVKQLFSAAKAASASRSGSGKSPASGKSQYVICFAQDVLVWWDVPAFAM